MKMKFGIFMAPFHAPGHNPTLSLENDLELIEHLDQLDFDEAWIGEHHSAGSEIIASPEIFIMAAAARTKRIKLGTGVVSLPYHNPLWVAERMVLLDHLTRAVMLVVRGHCRPMRRCWVLNRHKCAHFWKNIWFWHLLTSEEPISYESPPDPKNARLHLRSGSDPLDLAAAVAAFRCTAGRYGAGLLWALRLRLAWTFWRITGQFRKNRLQVCQAPTAAMASGWADAPG